MKEYIAYAVIVVMRQDILYPADLLNVEDLYERPEVVRAAFESLVSLSIGNDEDWLFALLHGVNINLCTWVLCIHKLAASVVGFNYTIVFYDPRTL